MIMALGKDAELQVTGAESAMNEDVGINLDALDGYVLPEPDEDVSEPEPKRKKVQGRERKGKILGAEHRENEEKRLEKLLFGGLLQTFDKASPELVSGESGDSSAEDGEEIDKSSDALPNDKYGKRLGLVASNERKAAWVDDDDEVTKLKDAVALYKRKPGKHGSKETSETNYKKHLEKKFASVHGARTPKWAELGKEKLHSDDDDEESESKDLPFERTVSNLLSRKSATLPEKILDIKRMKDVNYDCRTEINGGNNLKCVEFHKKQNVALVAGGTGVVTLFQVDGRVNPKIQSIMLDKFRVHQVNFSADGEEFFASSYKSKDIKVYNIVTGKSTLIQHNKTIDCGSYRDFTLSPDGKLIAYQGMYGYIHLMNARSKEWIGSMKMNAKVQALVFSADSSRLYSHGAEGEVYIWDVKARVCIHKFIDDGSVCGTAIALSPTQQYLACGSSSGVVNLYRTDQLENNRTPKPEKVILNLVTKVTGINFHPSSEMMSIYSSEKECAVRLMHLPSVTAFQNFPLRAKAGKKGTRTNCLDFSPNGGYMAIANNRGAAELYRLNHFDQY